MEKELFIDVLRHYLKSSENEALTVLSLKEKFPYSQVLHAVAARVSKDHQFQEHQKSLQEAAVYAADRSVLKSVMSGQSLTLAPTAKPATADQREYLRHVVASADAEAAYTFGSSFNADQGTHDFGRRPANGTHADSAEELHSISSQSTAPTGDTIPAEPSVVIDEVEQPAVNVEGNLKGSVDFAVRGPKAVAEETESVADKVLTDLERLNQLKHDFEVLYAAQKSGRSATAEDSLPEDIIEVSPAQKYVEAPAPPVEERVERMVEMDQALEVQSVPEELPATNPTPKPSMLRRKFGPNEAFIEEIVNRKEIEPENIKQREQLEMIEQFIKTQPTITPARDSGNGQSDDLASRSGDFTDNIVSETLVEILVKQGKKDKAIEVLKKLIWKFPQKKAYFAAQIEDLKK